MRAVAPVFQVYQLGADQPVWWRMVSSNGRGLARAAAPHPTVAAAHAAISLVRLRANEFEASLRLTESARWRWQLCLAGQPVVESATDLDRRVRCDHAWRNFVSLAPTASIDPVVHTFRISGETRLMSLRGSL